MSAFDDIAEKLNSMADDVMSKEAVVEDLKEDFKESVKKEEEFINDTIKTRKACIIDKKDKDSKSRKAAFKSSSSYSFNIEDDSAEEKKDNGYYGNYYGRYGFGYSEKKSDEEKKKESAKKKSKAIFAEAAKRASDAKSEDLFARHKAIIEPKKQSKTKDSFKGGLITAVLEACRTIIEIMEE